MTLIRSAGSHVAQRPTCVHQHLLVVVVEQLHERPQHAGDQLPPGRRLAAAQVRDRPRRVAQHGQLLGGQRRIRQRAQISHGAEQVVDEAERLIVREHEVAAARRVAGNVAQRPHRLLAHVGVRASHEVDEDRDGSVVDDDARVLRRAGGNVGERPSSLEQQRRVVVALAVLHEAWHRAGSDHLGNRRVALDRQQLAEPRRCLELLCRVAGLQQRNILWQGLELHAKRWIGKRTDGLLRRGRPAAACPCATTHVSPAFLQAVLFFVLADLQRGGLTFASHFVMIQANLFDPFVRFGRRRGRRLHSAWPVRRPRPSSRFSAFRPRASPGVERTCSAARSTVGFGHPNVTRARGTRARAGGGGHWRHSYICRARLSPLIPPRHVWSSIMAPVSSRRDSPVRRSHACCCLPMASMACQRTRGRSRRGSSATGMQWRLTGTMRSASCASIRSSAI